MGVSILSQKTLRSLSESHPSISTLFSRLSLPHSDSSRKPSETRADDKDGGFRSSPSNSATGSSSEPLGFTRVRFYSASASAAISAAASDGPESRTLRSLADVFRQKAKGNPFRKVVEMVRNNGDGDLGARLDSMDLKLELKFVMEILRVLNREKVSALSFFSWLQECHPDFVRNATICNLMIDNCGGCDDYENMRSFLVRFNSKGVALSKEAFQFLTLESRDECGSVEEEAIRNVVHVLKEVKGRVYPTGVRSMIEMLASSGSFDMAKLVIRLSDVRVTYYSVLIKEMCKKQEYEKAREVMREMRESRGDDDTVDLDRHIYNYMISTMLKAGQEEPAREALQEMMSKGCPPDALTFEIFICDCVAKGRFDSGMKFFDQMVEAGLEPRQSTHAAVMNLLFSVEHYDEAYEYVVSVSERFKTSGNLVYNKLAEHHRRKCNLLTSKNILCAMMSKGLAPDSNIYRTLLRSLKASRRKQDAVDLEDQYKRLRLAA